MEERINGKATSVIAGVVAIGIIGFAYRFYKKRGKNEIVIPAEKETNEPVEETEEYEIEMYEQPEEEVVINIFKNDDGWDYEQELNNRSNEEPYILHVDEYIGEEMGFKQETLTYYEGDDIMADITDTPVYNWPTVTGPLKWGHGSKDQNVVYVRNEKLRKEYEILRHSGSFETEVIGLEETELQHSVLKFRDR
jgi:hypothetical protein